MLWLFIISIALLLIGLADLPSGYYTVVRIVVCFVSCLSCYLSYKTDDRIGIATIIFAILAIVFNPIIPVYLYDKDFWAVIDVAAAILLGIRGYTLQNKS